MRRAPRLDLIPLLGALAERTDDETADAILDATVTVLVSGGLRRCTVEEIAERANLGRSTIYRRFDGRDEIIYAVIARELHRLLDDVSDTVEDLDPVEDKLVEGFIAGLKSAEASPLLQLVRSEPDLLLFLVDDAAPAIELVTTNLLSQLVKATGSANIDVDLARHGAEILFRLAVSFVLMPSSTIPLNDDGASRAILHSLFDPLLEGISP